MYTNKFTAPLRASKVRFSAEKFNGQNRLILDALIVKQAYSTEFYANIIANLPSDGFFQAINHQQIAEQYSEPIDSTINSDISNELFQRNLRLNNSIGSIAANYFIEPDRHDMMKAIWSNTFDFNKLVRRRY